MRGQSMTTRVASKTTRLLAAVVLIRSVATVSTQGAMAYDDTGMHQFFLTGSGANVNSSPSAAAASAPQAPARGWSGDVATGARYAGREASYFRRGRPFSTRSITVRLHDKAPPKSSVAQVPTKPATVSIFEDRTLRRGDAIMTANGVRIFAGSSAWPYTAADFVPLANAKNISKDDAAVLASLDRLPRT